MSGFFYGMRFEAPEKEVRLQAQAGGRTPVSQRLMSASAIE